MPESETASRCLYDIVIRVAFVADSDERIVINVKDGTTHEVQAVGAWRRVLLAGRGADPYQC